MPRATRNGNTPKSPPKSSKKSTVSKSGSRTRSRASTSAPVAHENSELTPRRGLRKRDITTATSDGSLTPMTNTSPPAVSKTSSKRRRVSEASSPPNSTSVFEVEEKGIDKAQTLKAKVTTAVKPVAATGSRKCRSAGGKRDLTEPDSPSTAGTLSKKARASSRSDSVEIVKSDMSPTVVVSPLKNSFANVDEENIKIRENELFSAIRLVPIASTDNVNKEIEELVAKTCDGNGKTHGSETLVPVPKKCSQNGSIAKASIVKKIFPKEPTKEERLALQRRQLLQHLDHYDLSDLTSLNSLLAGWPESDVRLPATLTVSESLKALHRIWVSERVFDIDGNNVFSIDGTPEIHVTKLIVPGGVPLSDDAVTIDSFCVASFTLSPAAGNFLTSCEQPSTYENIFSEVEAIKPDVFCVRNAHSKLASERLRPELMRRGYLCSSCPDGPSFTFPSFIFYNRDVFSEVNFRHLPVQATVRGLAGQSAYPQSWRQSLFSSLSCGPQSSESSADVAGPQLLVSVLRHSQTGSLLLVGCLTEKPILNEFPTCHSTSSSNQRPGDRIETLTSSAVKPLSEWNNVAYVTSPAGALTTTVSTARAGCTVTSIASREWCPPSFFSRPDLAAVHAAGALWALRKIWDDVIEKSIGGGLSNGSTNCAQSTCLLNGYANSEGDDDAGNVSVAVATHGNQIGGEAPPPFRWVLCANLEAAPTSPVYQIFRDGYPSDDSITRLRAVRNVHLEGRDFLDSTSLIDLLWHAFQHPCTDVVSCYNSVLGREPPFTRFSNSGRDPLNTTPSHNALKLRKCVDYIFCSSSTLHPRSVFLPPCRAIVSAAGCGGNQPNEADIGSSGTAAATVVVPARPVSHNLFADGSEIVIPLAARLSIRPLVPPRS